jgi:hypothetical protein
MLKESIHLLTHQTTHMHVFCATCGASVDVDLPGNWRHYPLFVTDWELVTCSECLDLMRKGIELDPCTRRFEQLLRNSPLNPRPHSPRSLARSLHHPCNKRDLYVGLAKTVVEAQIKEEKSSFRYYDYAESEKRLEAALEILHSAVNSKT